MLGRNDQAMIAALDPRLSSIIMSVESHSDRGCVLTVLKMINAHEKREARDKLWTHFEKKVARRIQTAVADLHRVYVAIEHEMIEKPSSSKQRLAATKARVAAMSKSFDGELSAAPAEN
jgi:hypothetical protein